MPFVLGFPLGRIYFPMFGVNCKGDPVLILMHDASDRFQDVQAVKRGLRIHLRVPNSLVVMKFTGNPLDLMSHNLVSANRKRNILLSHTLA